MMLDDHREEDDPRDPRKIHRKRHAAAWRDEPPF